MAAGWRQLRPRAGHALPALGLAAGVTVVLLAYPVWFGLAGPQAVTGVLFVLAPISGVPLSGLLVPGRYGAPAGASIRFFGYLGRSGPPADYVGAGVAAATLGAVVLGRRRPLTWLLLFLAAATFWLALGGYLISGPAWLGHPWLPWRDLSKLPLLREILPDQFVPLLTLFVAFLLAVGLDALHVVHRRPTSWAASHRAGDHRGRHRRRGRGRARAGLRDVRRAAARVVPVRTPGLPARRRTAAPGGPGPPHGPLRRVGLRPADVVAGDRGHALPPGRRRAQDAGRPGAGPSGRAPPGRPAAS